MSGGTDQVAGEIAEALIQEVYDEGVLPSGVALLGEPYHDDTDPEADPVIEVDGVPYVARVEVRLERWRPPGWLHAPRHGVGDEVRISGPVDARWRVLAVLGTQEDPRPGYRIRQVIHGEVMPAERIVLPGEVWAEQESPTGTIKLVGDQFDEGQGHEQ